MCRILSSLNTSTGRSHVEWTKSLCQRETRLEGGSWRGCKDKDLLPFKVSVCSSSVKGLTSSRGEEEGVSMESRYPNSFRSGRR